MRKTVNVKGSSYHPLFKVVIKINIQKDVYQNTLVDNKII